VVHGRILQERGNKKKKEQKREISFILHIIRTRQCEKLPKQRGTKTERNKDKESGDKNAVTRTDMP
jgi:hypothetical protein